MQDEFADSSRGQALINRIKDDAALGDVEVRVMAKNAAQNRVAVKRGSHGGGAAVAVDEPKPALDQQGTRRAPRIRIKDGVEVAVDGNPAALVDLSTVGAQVVSPTVLKPNQRVRVIMGDGKTSVKCAGAIAWAAFEMPKGLPTRYRAGIDWGVSAGTPERRGVRQEEQEGLERSQRRDDAVVAHDGFVAIGSGRDQPDRHATHLFEPLDVALRFRGQRARTGARPWSASSTPATTRRSA